MRLLRWSSEALDDLERIAVFNEQRSAAWAAKVHHRIVSRAASLASLPRQGRAVAGDQLRSLSIPDIRYALTYALDEGELLVLGVRSTREQPEEP